MKLTKALLISALIGITTTSVSAKEINKTLDVSPGGTLNLRTDSGAIEIDTHNKDSALIEVIIEGKNEDKFDVTIEEKGSEIIIVGEKEGNKGWNSWNNLRVKFFVTLPNEFDVELKTAGGSIRIEDIIGDVDANTSGGSIRLNDVTGNVDIHTSGGSIEAKNVLGEIDAHTSGGSIKAYFDAQPQEDASFTTSGGSIHARLPADVAIGIDASTSGGRVKSDFHIDGRIKRQSIRGLINGGGPEIELRTSGGSISIEQR